MLFAGRQTLKTQTDNDDVRKSADTDTESLHVDGFLKVSDARVNSSEIVERTRLRLQHRAEITFNEQ